MLTASIVCPHCQKSDLATFGELVEYGQRSQVDVDTAERTIDLERKLAQQNHSANAQPKGSEARPILDDLLPVAGILVCQACAEPMLALVEMTRIDLINHKKELHKLGAKASTRFSMDDLKIYPEPQSLVAHPAWPDRVKKLMPDIDKMLQQHFEPSIVISTSRTVIDVCMKDLEGEGRDIFGRINDLLEKGLITKPIADWAHKVRILGRDATHDADGSREEARDLVNFIHFFLRATYELSAEVRSADQHRCDVGTKPA